MNIDIARTLMEEFAIATGVVGDNEPRRYLWTDAFAVCNYLDLFQQTGEDRFLKLARSLVDQVHHILGRHRKDDSRRGWISGLSSEEGEKHPTRGGLRIGKPLNERDVDQPADANLEWKRDGQYFHYLTKWMHALFRMGIVTDERCYQDWAVELALAAHQTFTHQMLPLGPKGIFWKMSIDLKRPLVLSMGQHDPLDGLITYLELQSGIRIDTKGAVNLKVAIADTTEMCLHVSLPTDDPLGIGGLLDNATRLSQLIFEHGIERRKLLYELLVAAEVSLHEFADSTLLDRSDWNRLAFRELGLSIGIHGLQWISRLVKRDQLLETTSSQLLRFGPIADRIQSYWSNPVHQLSHSWTEHCDINRVMLATSLAPSGYLQLEESRHRQ
jgi:hypothetical protein